MNKVELEVVTGPVPMSDIQILYLDRAWNNYEIPDYIEHKFPAADEYVTWQVFAVQADLSREVLEQAVTTLLLYHDGLRLRVEKRDGRWVQYIAPPDTVTPFVWTDLSDLARDERQDIIKSVLLREKHSLSLKHGPIVKCVYFKQGKEESGLLFLILNHIAGDGMSLQILGEDLLDVLTRLQRGEEPLLPSKCTSIKTWSERIETCPFSEEWKSHLARLTAYNRSWPLPELTTLPLDYPDGKDDEEPSARLQVSLDQQETTALLEQAGKVWNVRILDLLQTALVRAVAPWAEVTSLAICNVVHGRDRVFEDIDVSRTVGCFGIGVLDVLALQDEPRISPLSDPNLIFAQLLLNSSRKLEMMYQSDGQKKYISFYDQYNPQIMLALRRQAEIERPGPGKLFQLLPPEHFPFMDTWVATKTLDCFAVLEPDQLKITWRFSPRYFKHATIEHLAQTYLQEIRAFIKPG